jgi:hypothetical protein
MGNISFEQVDWNSAGNTNRVSLKDLYVRLSEGENVVRVMENPIQFTVHWVVDATGSKRKVVSPIESPQLVKRLEDAGFKAQTKWAVKVLDRTTNSFKVLEFGSQILNGIRTLHSNKRWGNVTSYDITIIRGPKGSNPLYSVTPNPKEELGSDFTAQFQEFNETVDMDRVVRPTAPEKVCEIMGWTMAGASATTNQGGDDDFEFDFE